MLLTLPQLALTAYAQTTANPVVQTPFGLAHADCIHEVPNGAVVLPNDTVKDPNGATVNYGRCSDPILPTPCGTYGDPDAEDARNTYTSPAIGYFEANWTVPSGPTGINSPAQLIYLWNGLEDTSCYFVMQPVIQWGSNTYFGGDYWTMASWYVDYGGNHYYSTPEDISAGDSIIGEVQGTSCNSNGSCNNWNISIDDTTASVATGFDCGDSSLVCGLTAQESVVALEPSGTSACNQLPASGSTTFVTQQDSTGGTGITPSWSTYVESGFGCSTSVSTSGGDVTLNY